MVRFTWNNHNYEADVLISYHEDDVTAPNIEGWGLKQLHNVTRNRMVWPIYLREHYGLKQVLELAIQNHEPVNAPYDGGIKEMV